MSLLLEEKNELFEAVIGVVGVLEVIRAGVGLLSCPWSCKAAILAAVGMLSGPRFRGGRLRGCRLFLEAAPLGFCSASDGGAPMVFLELCFRALGLRWSLVTGSKTGALDRLPVELLLTLLVSSPWVDLRFSRNESSADESLGDSYALGIAGTGGTSSSSSAGGGL